MESPAEKWNLDNKNSNSFLSELTESDNDKDDNGTNLDKFIQLIKVVDLKFTVRQDL